MALSKAVMLSVFRRRGGSGIHTKPFDELEEPLQKCMLEQAQLGESEEPVIGSAVGHSTWVLITTKRTYWRRGEVAGSVAHVELEKAMADVPPEFGGSVSKMELSTIDLETKDGHVYTIEVEPGAAFFGVLNVLKAV